MKAIENEQDHLVQVCATQLNTAVVGDILDAHGRTHQFLPQPIQGLRESMVVCGRAMPVLVEDVEGIPEKPFGLLTEALDDLRPGEVYVLTGGSLRCAGWGEILTVTAKARGANGAVIDGFHRDTNQVLREDWPVFSRGSYAQDAGARASVVDFRCSVTIGAVRVAPGDIVFGDIDGVLIIPQDIAEQVIEEARQKLVAESVTKDAIRSGMSSTDAYATFGVL
ncbi:unannotated protein [freshwater metagenome]|uniref:Unannotated protein n=1 Tax=freshwater metagenome TaxID=449393 RepID=A0A6J6DXS3_9ZZZZ